jgi:hypothetical protein
MTVYLMLQNNPARKGVMRIQTKRRFTKGVNMFYWIFTWFVETWSATVDFVILKSLNTGSLYKRMIFLILYLSKNVVFVQRMNILYCIMFYNNIELKKNTLKCRDLAQDKHWL